MSLQESTSAFADAPFLLSDAPSSTDVLAKYFRAFGTRLGCRSSIFWPRVSDPLVNSLS